MREITIEYLVTLFIRRLLIIVLAAIVFAAAAFSYCFFLVQPVYKATSQIVITNGAVIQEDDTSADGTKISGSDIQSSIYLADVCVGLLQTQDLYKKLADKLENKYTYGQLDGFVSVALKSEDDLFINISVSHNSPEEAKKIANTLVAMAPDYLKEKIPMAKIIITATADTAGKVSPKTTTTATLFFVAGAAMAYIIALIVDLNDKTIKGIGDFTDSYNISVLGSVPNFESIEAQGGYSYAEKQ